jgi:hypothetical protein
MLGRDMRLLAALLILAMPATAVAAPRYAAPGGTGTACTVGAPCAVDIAMNDATTGDEVIVAPGDYGSTGAPLTTPIEVIDKAVDITAWRGSRVRAWCSPPTERTPAWSSPRLRRP